MSKLLLYSMLSSGVGLLATGEVAPTISNEFSPWLTAGGLGILGALLYVILSKTLPSRDKAYTESNQLLAAAIKDSAKAQNDMINSVMDRLHEDQIKIMDRLHGDQNELALALRELTRNCAIVHAASQISKADKKD
jgi:hypothetical protein